MVVEAVQLQHSLKAWSASFPDQGHIEGLHSASAELRHARNQALSQYVRAHPASRSPRRCKRSR